MHGMLMLRVLTLESSKNPMGLMSLKSMIMDKG